MKYFLALAFLILPFTAHAEELYSDAPQCAVLRNETKSKEFIAIRTDFYTKPDGARSYHEEVMQMKPRESRQVCAKGPFFPGYKVTLIVKSFFPLFECKTKLEGEIAIHEKPSGNGRAVWADCVN